MILLALGLLWLVTAYWETNKPLPAGVHIASPWYPIAAGDVTFIADITSADAYGRTTASQAIFDDVFNVIRSARKFVVLDYFLFNSQLGAAASSDADGSSGPAASSGPARLPLSSELRDLLIERRQANPALQVLFITDPINEVYGGSSSKDLRLLRAAGVAVAVTDLDRLRDSNFLYSGFWRLGVRWWTGAGPGRPADDVRPEDPGWLPNPLDESAPPIGFGAWARLLNFKANHRKIVIADDGRNGLVAIVGSANPHDASSAHSNTALKIAGPVAWPLLNSELDIARFSGWQGQLDASAAEPDTSDAVATRSGTTAVRRDAVATSSRDTASASSTGLPAAVRAQIITEGAIRSELLKRLATTAPGDGIDIAMFYLADRGVIEALIAASRRGVTVRLILDPNKDAFGHAKSGLPNQPVASELVASSNGAIHVRWYRTHGEQFHTKLVMIYGPERLWLTTGSANLTRRNLEDYNLEANVAMEVARGSPLALQTLDYFETLWSNRASLGIEYTAGFGYYADPSQLHYWLYRVMEGTGLSTF